MRARRVLFTVFALLVSNLVSAQTPAPTQRPPVQREFFSLGGRSDHLLLYQENYAAHPPLIKAALSAVFAVYQPLFDKGQPSTIPFQIVIWATDNPARGVVITPDGKEAHATATTRYLPKAELVADFPLADVTAVILDDRVCYILLHGPFFTSPSQEASIAHEMAHCYQLFYIASANAVVAEKADWWWIEGSANWLASLVYPAQFPGTLSTFFRYNRSVLQSWYTNLYFFSFVASPEGLGSPEAVVDLIKTITADPNTYPDVLSRVHPGQDSTETFHRWMFALLEGRVPFQPDMNLPGFTLRIVSGGQVRLNAARFSGDRAKVFGIKVDPGNKGVVTATALLDGNYAVSAKIGASWVRLPNGREVEFCPQNGGLELLVSRGAAPDIAQPDFNLIFTQKESDAPCVAKVPDATTADACITGAWVVTAFPPSILGGNVFEINLSEYVYVFHADGTYTGEYDLTAIPEETSRLDIDIPFRGTYGVSTVADTPGTYRVDSFTMEMLPGGTATLVVGSDTMQVAQTYYTAFQRYGLDLWMPQGTILCYEDEMSWNSAPGYDWTLERLQD